MDTYETMSGSWNITANSCNSVVSQDKSLDDSFYDAVRSRFLQQSAAFLSAECGYLAESEGLNDRAA